LLNVGKVLLLAKQAQVHAEETRGAGIEVTRKLHEETWNATNYLCRQFAKTDAVLCSKIADVHGI